MEMMTETGSYSFDAAFVQLNRLENLDLLPADTAYSSDGVVLSEHAAKRLGVSRGEQLLLGVFSEEYQQTIPVMEVTVQGIVEQMPTYGDAYLDWSIMKMTQPDAKFSKAFIQAEPDACNFIEEAGSCWFHCYASDDLSDFGNHFWHYTRSTANICFKPD